VTTRVVVVDDQPVVRAGFQTILDAHPEIEVVGEAVNGLEAVDVVARTIPDVVLMDIRMPELDGLTATRRILGGAAPTATRVLILTTFDVDDYVYEALRSGASGYLLKDATRDELVHAVQVVARGDAILEPAVARRLIEDFARRPAKPDADPVALSVLTAREREVFGLLAHGCSNAEIAEQLFVGEATMKTHVAHVLLKLQLRDRIQAVILAYELGVVKPG
jgi:DNA-binding NarL/FixJ family response regulator